VLEEKIKIIKTVYSQEVNKIVTSKKRGAGTNDLYEPKLAWFDIDFYEIMCLMKPTAS
jgi:hypothetical protein